MLLDFAILQNAKMAVGNLKSKYGIKTQRIFKIDPEKNKIISGFPSKYIILNA